MTRHDPDIRLRHMLDYGREATLLIQRIDQPTFEQDRLMQLAVVRLLEIVGEAAARTPEPVKSRHPDIPWRQISGLRNRLIHGYDTVDLGVVWAVLTVDLPELIARLDAILDTSSGR
jgi:uncharacterized protein with HEPN domain